MRKAQVYVNKIPAGILTELDDRSYTFEYDRNYLQNPSTSAVSLTMPKTMEIYRSPYLFPFFYNLLSEGANRAIQNRILKIDDRDYFSRLVRTAYEDTIGAVTIKEIEDERCDNQ